MFPQAYFPGLVEKSLTFSWINCSKFQKVLDKSSVENIILDTEAHKLLKWVLAFVVVTGESHCCE